MQLLNFLICDQNLKFTRNTFQVLSFNGLFFQTPAMVIVACLHNFLLLLKSYTFPVLSHVLFLCVAAASLRSVNRSPIFFTWCCSTVYFNFEIFQEKHSYFGPWIVFFFLFPFFSKQDCKQQLQYPCRKLLINLRLAQLGL